MLSIAPIASSKYYTDLASEDYYNKDSSKEEAGRWAGKGAEAMGLNGIVDKKDFSKIIMGFHHKNNNEALTKSAGKSNFRAGQDLVFSVPKSVTLARRLASPKIAEKIHQCELAAVSKATKYIESIAQTRTSAQNYQKISGAIFAIFEHSTSRGVDGQAPDPQDHYHCLMMSAALCEDGKTRSIDFRSVYQEKIFAGALFRMELANELRHVGFNIEKDNFSFKISGISSDMEKHFSKRGEQVKSAVTAGVTAAQRNMAARSSRSKKGEFDRDKLSELWKKEAHEKFGVNEQSVDNLANNKNMNFSSRSNDSILSGLSKKKPFLRDKDLRLAAALDCTVSGRDFNERFDSLKNSKGLNHVNNNKQMTYTPQNTYTKHTKQTQQHSFKPNTAQTTQIVKNIKNQNDNKASQEGGSGGGASSTQAGGTPLEQARAARNDIEIALKLIDPNSKDALDQLMTLASALKAAAEDLVKAEVAAAKQVFQTQVGGEQEM